MPLVKREVSPVRLAARPSCWGTADSGEEVTLRGEYDLTAVTNVTLCGALRQLASLVTAAQDVSQELQEELGKISNRSSSLAARLAALESRVAAHNPRAVPVPEGDLRSFSERQDHYHHTDQATADLFTETSRPPALRSLYDKAHQTPVHIMREIDQLRDDGIRSSRYFLCEPVLGDSLKKEKLRKLNLDIETRRPASFVALREWCSDDETLTEVCLSPVSPSVPARVCPPQKEPAAHKLPSPEQRVLALSLKYPPELVPIDVSGSGFKRLEKFRQSLVHFEYYKGKHRRKRVKRRNTIADTRDVQIALADREAASTSSGRGRSSPRSGSPSSRGGVSFTDRSFDTTETLDTTSNTTKTSSERENHPLSLGIEVCVPALPRNAHTVSRRMARENTFRENELTDKEGAGSSGGNPAPVVGSRQALAPHISEIVKNSKRDTTAEKQRSHLPILTHSPAMNIAVKLREGTKDECTRSSSGNWSASSSTRTSVESDQHRPLASPTSSYEQDSIPSESLHVRSSSPSSNLRTNSRTTDDLPSTSSHTSDGTLTPTQDIQDIPFLDDDTGSAYSCDTEGYYTSFHIDSGIRSVSYEGNKLAESEYELFGKGSTGTTNSSASIGTVVMRNPEKKTPPKPPQRVSSLERKQENRESVITVIHVNGSTSSREDVAAELPDKTSSQDGDSKSSRDGDSGRETSSSPTEPTSPRQPSLPSPEMECSESDLEADRQEILRVKTTINSSRIPSMCVITPPQSDDESVRSGNIPLSRESSGSQIDNQGQQAPPQGLLGSLVSQGQSHGVTAKMLSFQNSGAKSGGARSVGAISGGKSAVDDSTSEKDSGGKVPVVSHGYTPTLTVIPRGKDGDINAHLKGIMHTAAVSAPSRPDPDQPVLIRPSLVKQAEREKRLSQESDDSQNTELQRQTSKEEKQKAQGEKGQIYSSELISYKELPPPTTTTAHPFSAVPSSVKQNVVITPTNSLERRKANPAKAGARVTLNSDGKVVYSSDSLPRRKGHSSFEPGPYIKPQVTSSTQTQAVGGTVSSTVPSTAHIKPSASGASSSIQHTPLPPPPTSTVNTETSTLPHPMAQRPQQPLPHSATHVPPGPAGVSHPKQFLPVASQSTHSSSVTTTPSMSISTHKPPGTSQPTSISTASSAPPSHQQTTLLSKLHSSSSQQSHLPFSTQPHSVLPAASHPVPLSQPHPSLISQPHSALQAQSSLPLTSQPHAAPSPQLHPTLASQPHPVLPGQPHSVLPAQSQTILPSQTHQAPQAHPPLQHQSSLPSQPHIVSTQPHPILSQPHPVSSHPHPIQATQPHPVQSSQSLSTQMPTSSQMLSGASPQSVLLSSKQTASPHMSVKIQPKSDPLNTAPAPSPVPMQASMTRTPQSLPQQRLQQTTQQPQSPSNQKQSGVNAKGEDEVPISDKQISSVSGSSNSIYGTTQQQQLKQQQQQILQARQEAQMQLLQQQQQQIYQTRQEAQRVIQQQQLQQLQQQQLQKQQLQQLQQQQLQQQHLQQQYLYQTKDEAQMQLQQQQIMLQQPIYQTHQELQQARQHIPPPSQSQAQPLSQAGVTSGSVIMASQGAPMSPRSQRAGAYVHVQGQVSSGATPQQMVAAAQTSQGSQSSSKSGQRSQNSQGYTPGDTTSRAPTPVQGPITSSPHRGVHGTEAFTHQHLRTDPGTQFASAQASPVASDLDPSTDRVLLALAHARLATHQPFTLPHSNQDKLGLQRRNMEASPLRNVRMGNNSPFQRNNSYKLATTPLAEATNNFFRRVEGLNSVDDFRDSNLPLVNNTTVYGPRGNTGRPFHCLSRKNFMGQGKSLAVKRPISPGQVTNPNLGQRRFYGAQVMVNPALLQELKTPREVKSKENKTEDEIRVAHSGLTPRSKLNDTKPRIVGMVKKVESPTNDTEIW